MGNTYFVNKPIPASIVYKSLLKMGFVEQPKIGSSHCKFKRKDSSGKTYNVTYAPHHNQIEPMNLRSIIKQSGFSKDHFLKVLNET